MNKTVWNVSVFAVLLLIVPLLQGGGMRVCAQNTNPKESIEVYVEPSGGAVLLYDAPKGKTVCTLEEKGEYMFSVCSPKNGWWRICSKINTGEASEIEVSAPTWIYYSELAVRTRNYGAQTLSLYAAASTTSKVLYTFSSELLLRPMEIHGDWCKVQTIDAKYTGWIQQRWLCGNAVTTCPGDLMRE